MTTRLPIEIPYGPAAPLVARRHLDIQLAPEDAEVLARVEAALVEAGATVRSYRGEEPVMGQSAVLRWLLQQVRDSHLARIGLADARPTVEQ